MKSDKSSLKHSPEPLVVYESEEEALRNLPADELAEEGPLTGPPLQSRRDSRELVLKILYAREISKESWRNLLRYFLPEDENKYCEFARLLCENIQNGWEDIDKLIVSKSEKWDFSRIAVIDKLILRMAIAELLYFNDVPPKVTINEAIEIAKVYSTSNSSRFINGILDAVFNEVKENLKKNIIDENDHPVLHNPQKRQFPPKRKH